MKLTDSSLETPGDLVLDSLRPGLPLEPHTGQEPGATEGRVKGAQRRSGAEGTLDADRAPGMYREREGTR